MVNDPQVMVTCDKCNYEDRYNMTSVAQRSWDNRNLEAQLKRYGWTLPNGINGETICAECSEGAA